MVLPRYMTRFAICCQQKQTNYHSSAGKNRHISTLTYFFTFSCKNCIASEFSDLPGELHGPSSLHDTICYMLPTETNKLTFIGRERPTNFHFDICVTLWCEILYRKWNFWPARRSTWSFPATWYDLLYAANKNKQMNIHRLGYTDKIPLWPFFMFQYNLLYRKWVFWPSRRTKWSFPATWCDLLYAASKNVQINIHRQGKTDNFPCRHILLRFSVTCCIASETSVLTGKQKLSSPLNV